MSSIHNRVLWASCVAQSGLRRSARPWPTEDGSLAEPCACTRGTGNHNGGGGDSGGEVSRGAPCVDAAARLPFRFSSACFRSTSDSRATSSSCTRSSSALRRSPMLRRRHGATSAFPMPGPRALLRPLPPRARPLPRGRSLHARCLHGDVELAVVIVRKLMALDPQQSRRW